jgi:hypothetical protein
VRAGGGDQQHPLCVVLALDVDEVLLGVPELLGELPENKLVSTRDPGFVPSEVHQTG